MKIANATPKLSLLYVAAPSIRDGTGAVPYGAPCLMTLSSSPPCQRFDPRMRNIGAGGVYGYSLRLGLTTRSMSSIGTAPSSTSSPITKAPT